MLSSYFKIAFRNIHRNKVFSAINIFGLAVGLATCLLILLTIFDETGYDKYHQDADRIYRIASSTKEEQWSALSAPMGPGLKTDFTEVEQATRLLKFPDLDKMLLKYEQNKESKQFYETNGYYVDSSFFQVFTYHFKQGDSRTALSQPNTLVISETLAHKMFGNEDAMDRLVRIELPFGEFNYTVKGVFDDLETKSHINAHFFLSMWNEDVGGWVKRQTNWATNNIFHTYVKLKKGTDAIAFEQKLPAFLERNAGAQLKETNVDKTLFLQAVPDIYLTSNIGNEIAANGSMTYLYIFGCIGGFLLLIACINFMNLSTARAEKRIKEVGVRKSVGAQKSALIGQFLGESLLLSSIALVFALLLAQAFLPFLNNFTQKNLSLFQQPALIGWIVALNLLTGLLSGLYPAFYLSSFPSTAILKGKLATSFSAAIIRKGLVIFQFSISVALILVALMVGQQLRLIKNQDMGFNKSQQVILPFQSAAAEKNYAVLKQELLKNPHIVSASGGSTYPGLEMVEDNLFYAEGKSMDEKVDIHFARVDDDYIETLGYEMLSGRPFSKVFTADSNAIILNETAVKQLGYDVKDAVGKKIYSELNQQSTMLQIIGVVRDFNFRSLHKAIEPYGLMKPRYGQYAYFIATVEKGGFQNIIPEIEKTWKSVNPFTPFSFSFLDQDFQRNYEKEERSADVILYFTFIAIFIACMGLFGLASFTAEQRQKEVGVRKVLGASVAGITALLAKDFLKLVIVAIVIASPIAYFFMQRWLADFAYRIDIEWWMFVAAGLMAVVIAFLTVGFQSLKAALTNPVKSLRSE